MSAVPVTIVGIETREDGTSGNVTIVGMASITGLGVGGGPIMPPSGAHPEHPIVYPPGSLPHPEHPIVLPPPVPGWPPIDIGAHPEHPIVLPPPPTDVGPGGGKPPPPDGGWGYHPDYGWGYFPGPTQPGPKA